MKALSSFLLVFALTLPAWALEVPPLTNRVTDQVGILGDSAKQIEHMLKIHEAETDQQFALLVIPTLAGGSLEDFSMRVVEEWKLGQAGKDNGLLLLVVHEDRKIRFEVGYGLEGNIPDAFAGRIISTVMAPAFRAGKFGEGITEALKLVMEAGSGKKVELAKREPPTSQPSSEGYSNSVDSFEDMTWVDFAILFMMLFFFFIGGKGRSSGFSSGFSSGGGYSSGGSSFSGGGGSFGGGGASGGW